MFVPDNFYIVVSYSRKNPKALTAAHPGARLAVELTNTGGATDSFRLCITFVSRDQFLSRFPYDDSNLGVSASDACSNTSSLKSSTSNGGRLIRLATCTDAAALARLRSAAWWCRRPMFYDGSRHILPLALTVGSNADHIDDSESHISSHTYIEHSKLFMLKLDRCRIEWLSLVRESILGHVMLDSCSGMSTDLSELMPFSRLTTICLNKLKQVNSLSGLSSCTDLRVLRVHACPDLRDIAVIRQLPRLLVLDLDELAITSLVPEDDDALTSPTTRERGRHGKLEVVRLMNCPNLANLSFLRHHPHIASISMKDLPVTSLAWLSCHAELRRMVLQSLPMLRLSSWSTTGPLRLPFLKRIIIDVPNQESDLGLLPECTNLEELQLRWWNHEVDWGFIGRLRFLKKLRLTHNDSLKELDWIRQCTHLKVLNISMNLVIQDFSPIASLHCLEQLNLNATKVTDVHMASIAAECEKLRRVILDNCRLLTDLRSLGQLLNLRVFSASNTRITSIDWIVNCVHLTKVSLQKCTELDDTRPLNYLPFLRTSDL